MTWVTDQTGTRWVEPTARKRRARQTKGRFSELTVGDQLELKNHSLDQLAEQIGRRGPRTFYVVTDLWFDPVKGQDGEYRGQMVGYQRLNDHGEPVGRKQSTSRHGLAAQGFHKAELDFIAQCKARAEASNVVGIGFGRVLRRRPKMTGGL